MQRTVLWTIKQKVECYRQYLTQIQIIMKDIRIPKYLQGLARKENKSLNFNFNVLVRLSNGNGNHLFYCQTNKYKYVEANLDFYTNC